jgi:twitching motility protein PilT
MKDTAQNNQTNITYPTVNDSSGQASNTANVQPDVNNAQPNYGDFQGKIDTIPQNGIHDSLEDIMPSRKKAKIQKENDNVQSVEDTQEYLIPQKKGINLEGQNDKAQSKAENLNQPTENIDQSQSQQSQPEEQKLEGEQGPASVVDLGNTPLPDQKENLEEDISMSDLHNMNKQPEQQSIETSQEPSKDLPSEQANTEINVITPKHKISELLEQTIEKGASDLHISVGYPPVVRIDGQLEEISEDIIDPVEAEELILPLMSDDKRELLEVNKEIDFAHTYEGKYNGRFRINAFYAMRNLSAAFRLIPNRIRTIEELKLPQIYHQFAKLRQGLILVTGPTGHGKSTTIAAMIEDINRSRFSRIITIEDPVEYVFQGKKSLIDQREMGQDTHSWPIALKSAMRQDPDVILVGEMRDYETISSAITLAETGHLVFATLHTNNSAQSIDRMIDVFPEEQQAQIRTQLSNILEVVIAQRLIPLDSGGRRAVAEILVVNPAIKTLIRESKTHQIDNVIRTSSDVGMISLERSLVDLVREGVINTKTAQEFAVYPEEVSRLLKS